MVRTRNKPPSLVSMWMLDVFCCALGCVTLLWLLNSREAADQAKRAGSTLALLSSAEAELARTQADLESTRRRLTADIDDLRDKLAATTTERDETAKTLVAKTIDLADAEKRYATAAASLSETRAILDSTIVELSDATKRIAMTAADRDESAKRLAAETARAKELAADLARKQDDAAALSAKLSEANRSTDDLAKLLRAKESERDVLENRLRAAMREIQDAAADKAASKRTGDELAAAARDLQSKLNEASATIIDLQGQKAKLADKYDKLRADSENRFAGIALTGKRVVFVIDTSGSMKRLDPATPDPNKWPIISDTLGKVMRSLPGLEQFQIVTFSDKAKYLSGSGGWLDFRGEESVRLATAAVLAIDPDGGTNIHDALDLAFRLRPDGLDTVYLFSDGLPTSGPGLTPAQEKLSAAEQTDLLARQVRRSLLAEWNRPDASGNRVRVNSLGFYFESPEVGAFLWAMSRENDGSFVGMSRP